MSRWGDEDYDDDEYMERVYRLFDSRKERMLDLVRRKDILSIRKFLTDMLDGEGILYNVAHIDRFISVVTFAVVGEPDPEGFASDEWSDTSTAIIHYRDTQNLCELEISDIPKRITRYYDKLGYPAGIKRW